MNDNTLESLLLLLNKCFLVHFLVNNYQIFTIIIRANQDSCHFLMVLTCFQPSTITTKKKSIFDVAGFSGALLFIFFLNVRAVFNEFKAHINRLCSFTRGVYPASFSCSSYTDTYIVIPFDLAILSITCNSRFETLSFATTIQFL